MSFGIQPLIDRGFIERLRRVLFDFVAAHTADAEEAQALWGVISAVGKYNGDPVSVVVDASTVRHPPPLRPSVLEAVEQAWHWLLEERCDLSPTWLEGPPRFDPKATRRRQVEAAVEAAYHHLSQPPRHPPRGLGHSREIHLELSISGPDLGPDTLCLDLQVPFAPYEGWHLPKALVRMLFRRAAQELAQALVEWADEHFKGPDDDL